MKTSIDDACENQIWIKIDMSAKDVLDQVKELCGHEIDSTKIEKIYKYLKRELIARGYEKECL